MSRAECNFTIKTIPDNQAFAVVLAHSLNSLCVHVIALAIDESCEEAREATMDFALSSLHAHPLTQ